MDLRSHLPRDPGDFHYAVRILAGTTVVRLLLRATWRVGPVTAALVLTTGVVALAVTSLVYLVWPPQQVSKEAVSNH